MSFKVCKYMCVQKANVGSNKKATGYQQLYIVSYSLIKSYFSDEHISTFNSSPVKCRPHSSKSVRMHHLPSLVSFFSQKFQFPKHLFKQHQNAPFSFLSFKIFYAVLTAQTPFQIAPECTIQFPCFQNFLSSSDFQTIVSNSIRMHH